MLSLYHLYANEWDVEGFILSSSQYHWRRSWADDGWVEPYLEAYAKVYRNLLIHDPRYPTPEFLRAHTLMGNVKAKGEMNEVTPGSQRIVEVLLDESDPQPVWIQAWGGTNTITWRVSAWPTSLALAGLMRASCAFSWVSARSQYHLTLARPSSDAKTDEHAGRSRKRSQGGSGAGDIIIREET